MRPPKAPKIAPVQEPSAEPLAAPRDRSRSKRTPELEAALGARIRAARVAARISQTDLGAVVGITFQQVQKYESGKDRVAASTLQGFATALGVHPGSFFDDTPMPVGSIPDVKAAMRAADVLQQIRDPRILKQLLALAREVVKAEARLEQPAPAPDEAD